MKPQKESQKQKGIYRRGNIFWIRYAGLDGKVVFESSQSEKLKDAEDLLHRRKADLQQGKMPEAKKIKHHTFENLAKEYKVFIERQRSYAQKLCNVNQVVRVFGNVPLRRFSTMLLEQYQTEKLNEGKKPATVNRHLALLKHMFTKAVDWDMVEEDALRKVRKVKLLPENNRRLRYLSKEECRLLLDVCDEVSKKNRHYEHLKPIVVFALNTGCRKEEILSLTWNSVDLQNGFILLDRTKNGERREIPINDTLRDALNKIPKRIDGEGYVFFDPITGERYGDVKNSFRTVCKKAKILDFKFHDLRHTFASQLVMAGADITTVKELLGHKTLTMTLRYSHLSPSHRTKAVNLLDYNVNEESTIQKLDNLRVAK